jgi:hypothetical protein
MSHIRYLVSRLLMLGLLAALVRALLRRGNKPAPVAAYVPEPAVEAEPAPVVEEPVAAEPVAEEPVAEDPVAEAPANPFIPQDVVEPELEAEEIVDAEPVVEEPVADEPEVYSAPTPILALEPALSPALEQGPATEPLHVVEPEPVAESEEQPEVAEPVAEEQPEPTAESEPAAPYWQVPSTPPADWSEPGEYGEYRTA